MLVFKKIQELCISNIYVTVLNIKHCMVFIIYKNIDQI
jgi:hypothetical protein